MPHRRRTRLGVSLVAGILASAAWLAPSASGQWTNRYPLMEGYGRHIYQEGYELPILGVGPTDPAPSPDGETVAVASRGWIWVLGLESRRARRVTSGAGVDSRPAFSPDGRWLVFVRDDSRDTDIVALDLSTGDEKTLVDTPALDLDPAFSPDGRFLYYSSAEGGDLDLWRMEMKSGEHTRITGDRGLELRPQSMDDGSLLYLRKGGGMPDQVVVLEPDTAGGAHADDPLATRDGAGEANRRILAVAGTASQTRPGVAPDRYRIAVNLPDPRGWRLWLLDAGGGGRVELAPSARLPLTPAWSPDGEYVYYVEADGDQRFHLWRVPAAGGAPVDVSPLSWDWQAPTGRVRITTRTAGALNPVPARLAVVDASGHPAVPSRGQPRFDPESGTVYSYSPGIITLAVPAGEVRVTATRGLTSPAASASRSVGPGETVEMEIEFEPVWDPAAEGWYSGDHHFHLDWGGTYRLTPEDLVPILEGEDLAVGTPLAASLDVRVMDLPWWGWERLGSGPPLIRFGQEVRPGLLGHTGFLGHEVRFWPNYWGPGYPVYTWADIPKADAHRHVHRQGGISFYVHPVNVRQPFPADAEPHGIPLELVPDGVLGDLDALEVACLWSDELGTSEVWYRLLSLGRPVVPTAGSDALVDWYRSMSVGADRAYVRLDGPLSFTSYFEGLRAGRSFVTTGPMLRLGVAGVGPGEVVAPGKVEWTIALDSAVAVETVEILVNGEVAWSSAGLEKPGHRFYRGNLDLPSGGWLAARAHGGDAVWPMMDSYPFAHTAPTWIGSVGSTDDGAARRAATDLLRWMDVAEARLETAYEGTEIPRLRRRFAAAREALQSRLR